jgi:transposase InsO family protein
MSDIIKRSRRRHKGSRWTRVKRKKSERFDWKVALNEIYTTIGKAGALSSSPHKLLKELKNRYNIKIPISQIQSWLEGKVSHSLHKSLRLKFNRNPIISPDIDYQWQGDLMFLNELSRFNKGYKIALVMIDIVSRFAWGVLMKNKKGPTTTEAFKQILKHAAPRKPQKLQTDKGTEFLNSNFQSLLKTHNVKFFTTYSDTKAAVAERFIQTLKKLIYKYLAENNTNIYIDKFQDLITTYNNTIHSSIKFAPSEVSKSNQAEVMKNLYGFMWEADTLGKKENKFKINDYVRISKIHSNLFRKSYKGNWTDEMFKIAEIKNEYGQVTYGVEDLNGKEIMGSFYEPELQKIPEANMSDQYWKIEKVIKTKQSESGKKSYFVKWDGFDDSHNSWVSADKMKTYR